MTKDEIMELSFDAIEERAAEIAIETADADAETLEKLNAELEALEERKTILKKEADEKRAKAQAVARGAGTPIDTRKEEKPMEMEIRKKPEYLDAWVEFQKGRATEEQRALLTENATNGTIAVPAFVEDTIHTAWESNELFRRIRRTYFPGVLKVGYESAAGAASIHTEGGAAVPEEELVIGTVEMIPQMVKKWVSVSDEVLDMRGEAFVNYIIDELTDKIIKGVISAAVTKMINSDLSEAVTAAGSTLATVDVVTAGGALSGEASDPVLITTRANAAALKAAALQANYGYDPTDGMPIVYVDTLPNAGSNAVYGIVADLSGVTANFPNGEDVKIKVDDLTLATSDMVRIIGRLYMAVDVTATGKVALIVEGE